MKRSMMQMYIRGSVEAVRVYQEAFGAELISEYKNDDGSYMHAELNAFGQTLAISEAAESLSGSTMQFCFHLHESEMDKVKHAYEALKDGAEISHPVGECFYSKCMFGLVDKFGVNWCLFV